MGDRVELTQAARQDLARRYADGEVTLAEMRAKGVWRMTQLLSDLAAIGRRPPIAKDPTPDEEARRAGMDRLNALMAR